MTVLPITRQGAVYAMTREIFPDADIQETTYRYYYKLSPTTVPISIDLTSGKGTVQPGEHFIDKNDGVIIHGISVGLVKVNTELVGNINNYPIYCYPDLSVFNGPSNTTGGQPTQTEAACLEALYQGAFMQMQSNNKILLSYLGMERFRQVPVTQASTGVEHASYNNLTRRIVDIVQPAILTGQSTLELKITPGSGADVSQIGGKEGYENYVVIELAAFSLKNFAQSITSGNLFQAKKLFVDKAKA